MFFSTAREFVIPPDWIYRGEGNCNLVIALPQRKKILRIRKISKGKSLISWLIDWITDILNWYCWNAVDDETRDLAFYRRVIRPLIDFNFAGNGEQVFLSKRQIRRLEAKLDNQRPECRKGKRLQYGRAALFDDYAFILDDYLPFSLSSDTFAVEIKPKQGWIPFSERRFPKCTFCMNQYLKRQKGQTKALSSYCPLDLFSGEVTRMVQAIKALLISPQNNFKVFKNGTLAYGEHQKYEVIEGLVRDFFGNEDLRENLLEEFCLLVQKCLTVDFQPHSKSNTCRQRLFCEWNKIIQSNSVQSSLPKGSVLERILSVQMLDAEGNQYYSKLLRNRHLEDFQYVRRLLKTIAESEGTCLKCSVMMLGNRKNDLAFVPYLISAVAKDCSLMVTFQRIVEPLSDDFRMQNVVRTKYGNFIVNIGVFDLYPKPLSTVLKHMKRMRKMVDLCAAGQSVFKNEEVGCMQGDSEI